MISQRFLTLFYKINNAVLVRWKNVDHCAFSIMISQIYTSYLFAEYAKMISQRFS